MGFLDVPVSPSTPLLTGVYAILAHTSCAWAHRSGIWDLPPSGCPTPTPHLTMGEDTTIALTAKLLKTFSCRHMYQHVAGIIRA